MAKLSAPVEEMEESKDLDDEDDCGILPVMKAKKKESKARRASLGLVQRVASPQLMLAPIMAPTPVTVAKVEVAEAVPSF